MEKLVFLSNVLVLAFRGPTMAAVSSKMERRRGRDKLHQKHILRGIEIKEIRVLVMLADEVQKISSAQT